MELTPGGARDRNRIEAEILEVKRHITSVEALGLAEKYPELLSRRNDTGLSSGQSAALQQLHALELWKEDLRMLEAELQGK